MNNINYSDFYRFLASLGMALVVLAFAVPWAFTQNVGVLKIPAAELASYTPSAQESILAQQRALSVLSVCTPYFPAGVLLGLIVLGWGMYLWYNKQQIQDESEAIDLEKKRTDYVRATGDQRVAAVKEQLAEEGGGPEPTDESDDSPAVGAPTLPPDVQAALQKAMAVPGNEGLVKYLQIEAALDQAVRAVYTGIGVINTHFRLSNIEYDALVQFTDHRKDLVLEYKYFSRLPQLPQVHRVAKETLRRVKHWTGTTSRSARGVVVFVVPEDVVRDGKTEGLLTRIYHELNSERPGTVPFDLGIHFVSEDVVSRNPVAAVIGATS
jgi:hypothetical protein